MTAETATRRIHLLIRGELLDEIDALVGRRRRSQFIAEAVAARLARDELREAIAEMDGALADSDVEGWESPQAAAAWVRAMRVGEHPASAESAA
ncbi:MAG: hypothetical protein H0U10_15230 [Chloroflexia bacterium]|jgi:hypothetical protein|nr:hypothetical protein [Chloroflexia bacterium]